MHASNYEPVTTPLHPIKSGEYTLLLILERELERVRYAFLTADEAGQTRELSAHDLAASDSAAAKIWDRGVQQIKIRQEGDGYYNLKDAYVELCDDEIVRKVVEVAKRFGEEFGKELGSPSKKRSRWEA